MSIKNPCKKGRKRHRWDSDGYCVWCNKPRIDVEISEREATHQTIKEE